MAEIFIRRTTAILLFMVAALVVACVGLLVFLFAPSRGSSENVSLHQTGDYSDAEKLDKLKENPDRPLESWERNIRIPETTLPYHYDLTLFPDLASEKFSGNVVITIGVTEPMDYLLTHVKFLNITSTQLEDSSGREMGILEAFEYKPNEFWVVRPKEVLSIGNYTLSIGFNGLLRGSIVGLYMSDYITKSGKKRVIATSKFQATDARRAFPCFDEPSFKSTFQTTLIKPSNDYIALSNMPVKREIADSPSPGMTTVEFEKSVPMVTYLACFIVCDFEFVQTFTNKNKPFRVYARKDQVDRSVYARDIGVAILNYFEEYFEVEYPLPKQDMIAIPDFVSGAMEHWGLITYRETNLLYDEVNSSSYNKQRVATVVSHELAHMWFGNLVTLKWWDDLWLNEGFASYIEYKGVANYEKDWDMEYQFVTSDLQPVLKLDEILSSHPIVQPVHHPDEITEIFDQISYSKGASVLRMLEDFIGAENFRKGVRNFLRRFKYGNAVTEDLWKDLQATTKQDLDIARVMDTWTRQMGYPVINVKISSNNRLEVTQQRFLVDPEAKSRKDSPFNYKWDIPVTFKTESSTRQQIWLKMEQNKLLIPVPSVDRWVKFNVDQYGYYRVNYDPKLWNLLIDLLKKNPEVLSPADRSSLIDDSFALSAAKLISYDVPFGVSSYLSKETHFVPWSSAYNRLDEIGKLLQNTEAYSYFRKFVLGLVNDHVNRFGWDDSGNHIEKRTRILLLSLACENGHSGCNEGAIERFRAWILDPSFEIAANLRTIVYKYGIKGTGEEEWNVLLDRFSKELNAQEKIKMLAGLTATKEPWITNRLLELSRNESIIRKQDYFTVLNYLSDNPSALSSVWEFVRINWEWMVKRFCLKNRYMGQMIKNVAYKFTSSVRLKELLQFFKDYPDAGAGKRGRTQAIEQLQKTINWLQTYGTTLSTWFKENS